MPVDYSKWDALELSDDSDIEVHPNVDKRSFIRAKQAQIHQERERRRHQIKTLKYERIINDGLMLRIDRLLTALKSHKAVAASQSADELVFQALIESAGDPEDDQPPPPPEGVHQHIDEKPTYSRMMAALVDQVKKAVDEKKEGDRYEGYIREVELHRKKVEGLQKELLAKLAELEKEEKRHITSDDIHEGFNVSHVDKSKPQATTSTKPSKPAETVEVLNPGALKRDTLTRTDTGESSGFEADVEEDATAADDEEHIEPTAEGKEFGKIKIGDYRACIQFISSHPSVLAERNTDGLLIQAFNAQLEGKDDFARQCVHQALLLQYCRQLGRDGVALFFKRIMTKDHQAQKLFLEDAEHIKREREENPAGSQDVEQIQLHAVDPNTTINIVVPPADSEDPAVREARRIFEAFPPGLQRALETGTLDEVNKVLGKMSVGEAEEVVEQLGMGGMLSIEEGVIDATTEEGKAKVKEIEQTGKYPGMVREEDLAGDPE
ncbi:hsp90 co-chaperone Cdc37 [Coniosporium tulheliwenetii]|uniref:Hsp90 co-chaperone Cdc37 n=1 Tax=Coniosporium tulheliwenetii TaxID=3383036 RepID=A0ACC2ZDU9_9PEZI|nr:hsp90 co-chaperone Cdc37 [Cladosporium sp. JES 115]